jgi:hypothetical protein
MLLALAAAEVVQAATLRHRLRPRTGSARVPVQEDAHAAA